MSDLDLKIKEAEQTLRLGAEMSAYYYHQPLIICYSGGKDSDVMLDIAKKCLNKDDFEVINSHTTLDAPETVYHIREVFKNLEKIGIKVSIHMPTYKGKPTSMWRLIEDKGIPPTRIIRYCCDVLKETTTPNRMAAVGVREDESNVRRGRDSFGVRVHQKKDVEYRSTQHTYAMFKLDKLEQETYECKMIEACKENKDTICNPIYKFTEKDIWSYVERFDVPMNPLYARGYKRIGCIGCPMGDVKQQNREFNDYPKYRENYVKAFDRMLENRKKKRMKELKYNFTTGEEVMRWWLGENPMQVRIEDILQEEKDD